MNMRWIETISVVQKLLLILIARSWSDEGWKAEVEGVASMGGLLALIEVWVASVGGDKSQDSPTCNSAFDSSHSFGVLHVQVPVLCTLLTFWHLSLRAAHVP